MIYLRWSGSILILAASMYVICGNAVVFWVGEIRRRRSGSWVPVVGGLLGVLGILLLPVAVVHFFWWVPLLADWGCVPGFAYTGAWYVADGVRRRGR